MSSGSTILRYPVSDGNLLQYMSLVFYVIDSEFEAFIIHHTLNRGSTSEHQVNASCGIL